MPFKHFTTLLLLAFGPIIWAQPSNDDCNNAQNVLVSTAGNCENAVMGNTTDATDSGIFSNFGFSDDDVWYTFTATEITHLIVINGITLKHPGLHFYNGDCNAFLYAVDANTSGDTLMTPVTGLTPGETYTFRVHSLDYQTGKGTFSLCVLPPPAPPANDDCDNAQVIIASTDLTCSEVSGTTWGATSSAMSGGFASDDDDLWYSFTATSTTHLITTAYSVMFANNQYTTTQPVMEVYSGDCSALVASTNTFGYGPYLLVQNLNIGETYKLHIFTEYSGLYMNFTICLRTPAPAPANDECTGAIQLPVNGPDCINTVTAVTGGETSSLFNPFNDDDVWFWFVATNQVHVVSVSDIVPFSVVDHSKLYYDVYKGGDCATFQYIKYNDPGQLIIPGLTPGDTCFVRLFTIDPAQYITFDICVTTPLPGPPNDTICTATVLTPSATAQCTNPVMGTTENAYNTPYGSFGNAWAEDDVWYTFTATSNVHKIWVEGISISEPVIEVYTGVCDQFPSFLYFRTANPGSNDNIIQFDGFIPGKTYYIRVYSRSYEISAEGTFTICLTTGTQSTVANDACIGAIEVPVNPGPQCINTISGTTVGAGPSLAPGCGSPEVADDDVWYKFVATSQFHIIKLEEGSLKNAVIQLFFGTCDSLSYGSCINNNEFGTESATLSILEPGRTYYFRVFSAGGNPTDAGTFQLCLSTIIPAPNTTCATAIPLTVTPTCSNPLYQNSYIANPGVVFSDCGGYSDDALWYTFQATAPQQSIIVSGENDYDAIVSLYEGGCNNNATACRDTSYLGGTEIMELDNLTVGATYNIEVFSSLYGGGGFTICVTGATSGTNEQVSESGNIRVYPNPVTQILHIEAQAKSIVRNITIYNMQSVECLSQYNAENAAHLNISALPSGAYMVKIQTDLGIWYSKVIKA